MMQMSKRRRGHRARLELTPAQEDLLTQQGHAARALRNSRAKPPTFKSRHRAPLAVDAPQGAHLRVERVHRRWGMVNIPKVGRVRFRWTKDLPGVTKGSPVGRITGARMVKDSLGRHIAFRTEIVVSAQEPRLWAHSHIGIDRGITVPLALSDGSTYEHDPWLTDKEQENLLRAEQAAAHRKRYRKKGERASSRLRARAKRRALDWQHKTTTAIADTFALVTVEDLRVTSMIKSAKGTAADPGTNVAAEAGLNRTTPGFARDPARRTEPQEGA